MSRLQKTSYILLTIIISIIFILLAIFRFPISYIRLYQSAKDLIISFLYYFVNILRLPIDINVTITTVPDVIEFSDFSLLPKDFEIFKLKTIIYFKMILNIDTMLFYINYLLIILRKFFTFLLLLFPLFYLSKKLIKRYYNENDLEPNSNSKFLKMYKLIEKNVYLPIINYCKAYLTFLSNKHYLLKSWKRLWFLNFSIYVIILEALAYYLYFIISFDLLHIYLLVYKLLFDISHMVIFVPSYIWLIIVVIVLLRLRVSIAYKRLYHYESRNKGLINTLGQVSLICGEMGTGKTSTLTDITLSLSVMHRQQAFKKILECDVKFPNFPYVSLEKELKIAMQEHIVYNLATAKAWIQNKYLSCSENGIINNIDNCFGYDYKKYGLIYYDNLKQHHLFDVLEIYVQVYFIYVINTSLIISNYAIREDNIQHDLGHFPMWDDDFFRRDVKLSHAYEKHSHILDFDMLRLGKQLLQDNINKDILEFGLVIITEGGKERLNMLGTREMKIKSDDTNQLNDLMDLWIKMYRHSATVDNYCFGKVLFDEQRAMSFGADVREICEKVLIIKEKSPTLSTLLFFDIDTMIYDFFHNIYINYYYKYRFYRSDNTLLFYLLRVLAAKIITNFQKKNNLFGLNKLILETNRGNLSEEVKTSTYYLCFKKIYATRYSTDCFSDFFDNKSIKSPLGLLDLQCYDYYKASIDELKLQNSYFINKLTGQVFKE